MTTSAMKSAISGVVALGAGQTASMDTNRFLKGKYVMIQSLFHHRNETFRHGCGEGASNKMVVSQSRSVRVMHRWEGGQIVDDRLSLYLAPVSLSIRCASLAYWQRS